MIDIIEIKNGLYDFFDALCDHQDLTFNIQWARNNQNKSELPRIELDILTLPSVGSPIQLTPDSVGLSSIVHESNLILRVVVAGENSLTLCTLVKMTSLVPEIIDDLRDDTGLSILNSTEPTNISGFNDQYVEERWTMDITFTFAYDMTEVEVGLIEHVSLSGDLVKANGSLMTIPVFTINKT
jgi:hypothetical protein